MSTRRTRPRPTASEIQARYVDAGYDYQGTCESKTPPCYKYCRTGKKGRVAGRCLNRGPSQLQNASPRPLSSYNIFVRDNIRSAPAGTSPKDRIRWVARQWRTRGELGPIGPLGRMNSPRGRSANARRNSQSWL